jgi:hypothetical protein
MSRRRKKRYIAPSDDDLSFSVYVNANGMFMHTLLASMSIAGVFQWEDNLDFYTEFSGEADDLFNF